MTSPFLEAFLAATPRQLGAPTLAAELRERIQAWFTSGGSMPDSEAILTALADLAAEQISANPTIEAQCAAFRALALNIDNQCAAANRRRMGGVPVKLVVKQ